MKNFDTIIYSLFFCGFISCHPTGVMLKKTPKLAEGENKFMKPKVEMHKIVSKSEASIIDLLFNRNTTPKKLSEATTIQPSMIKSLDANNRPMTNYMAYPSSMYPAIPHMYQPSGISNSISTSQSGSNSQTIAYPNGVVSSASSSHSSSVSQTGPIAPIGPLPPVAPIGPVGVSSPTGPIMPVNPVSIGSSAPSGQILPIMPSAHSQSQTSVGATYAIGRSSSVATRSNSYGSSANSGTGSMAATGLEPFGPIAIANGQAQPMSTIKPLFFQRFKRNLKHIEDDFNIDETHEKNFVRNKNIAKALNTKNLIKYHRDDERGSQPRTFNVIIDVINGFLNPVKPPTCQPPSPCAPPIPHPPGVPPVPPIVPPVVPPAIPPPPYHPVLPCQSYPHCTIPPCYPPCQPLTPTFPHSPILPNRILPNNFPIPACSTSKVEKNGKQNTITFNNNNSQNDSGEQITNNFPCYQTGTSVLKVSPNSLSHVQSTIDNHVLTESIYLPSRPLYPLKEVYPAIKVYPINNLYQALPAAHSISIDYPVYGSGYSFSSSSTNVGPFSSSSSLSTTQTGTDGKVYGYFDSYSKTGPAEQRLTGIIGLLETSVTTVKRFTNGSCEIERTITMPCKNGSLYQLKVVTLESNDLSPYPKRVLQTITIIPPKKENEDITTTTASETTSTATSTATSTTGNNAHSSEMNTENSVEATTPEDKITMPDAEVMKMELPQNKTGTMTM